MALSKARWCVAQLVTPTGRAWFDDDGQGRQADASRRRRSGKGRGRGAGALRPTSAAAETYADRVSEMADWLGEDHVAFGTDMNALSGSAIADYVGLRRVVNLWERRQVNEARIRKIAIENYARVLKQALVPGAA